MYDLEQATGNPQAAFAARQQAIASYLAYRRAGGGNHERPAQICVVAEAISAGQTADLQQALAQIVNSVRTDTEKLFIAKLQAVLSGDHNPAFAEDPNLPYSGAVELQLLLEGLRAGKAD